MSAIAGFVGCLNNQIEIIKEMNRSLEHRTNAAGSFKIFEGAVFGSQAFTSRDKRYSVLFDGEIYNKADLSEFLENPNLDENSDAELLLYLWGILGEKSITRLNGNFAFALWDDVQKELYCVRDRVGTKPLYYFYNSSQIVFASEANAILQHPLVGPVLNIEALQDYLSLGYITATKTIYKNVFKLLPAHYLKFKQNTKPKFVRYWNISEYAKENLVFCSDEFCSLLTSAIKYRTLDSSKTAAFLSGGVDSAAIVSIASKISDGIDTFTIGFKEKSFDESTFAAAFAAEHNLKNYLYNFDCPTETFLNSIASFQDQPFSDTSVPPLYQLCQHVAKNTNVVLSGDGADELFGGYETCRADLAKIYLEKLPFWHLLTRLLSRCVSMIPSDKKKVSLNYKLRQFFSYANLSRQKSHFSWRLMFDEKEKRQILNPDFYTSQDYDVFDAFSQIYESVEDLPILRQHAIVDIKTWLSDDGLFKWDLCAAPHRLKLRAPFLDHRLIEYAIKIPENRKFNLLKTKKCLKTALKPLIGNEVVSRKKSGFNSPVSLWLEGPLKSLFLDSVHSQNFRTIFPFPHKILELFEEQQDNKRDNGHKLWTLLMFALWQKNLKNHKNIEI